MTGISTAITVLSCSLFAAALIKMLAPSGNTEKLLRLVIGLFVLICVATSFKAVADSVDASEISEAIIDEKSQDTSLALEENVLKVTGEYMAEYVKSLLLQEGIEVTEVKVTVTNENSVINLSDVVIYIDESKVIHKGKITEIIKSDLNITPEVKIKE